MSFTYFHLLPLEFWPKIMNHMDDAEIMAMAATCHRLDSFCYRTYGVNRHDYARYMNGQPAVDLTNTLPHGYSLPPFNLQNPIAYPSNSQGILAQAQVTGSTSNHVHFNLTHQPGDYPSASSTASPHSSESQGGSDTEITTPEEEEWPQMTADDIMILVHKFPNQVTKVDEKTNLNNLPTELHCEIFSYLDKIDSTCLGLTFPRAYAIYRSIFGTKMPLNTRRSGPNLLERAWEVVGKQECSHCGIYRCELHLHLKSWMPQELEYCSFKGMFGTKAEEGVAPNCYRGKPSKPRRCGRHPLRTTSVHQDDNVNALAMTKA